MTLSNINPSIITASPPAKDAVKTQLATAKSELDTLLGATYNRGMRFVSSHDVTGSSLYLISLPSIGGVGGTPRRLTLFFIGVNTTNQSSIFVRTNSSSHTYCWRTLSGVTASQGTNTTTDGIPLVGAVPHSFAMLEMLLVNNTTMYSAQGRWRSVTNQESFWDVSGYVPLAVAQLQVRCLAGSTPETMLGGRVLLFEETLSGEGSATSAVDPGIITAAPVPKTGMHGEFTKIKNELDVVLDSVDTAGHVLLHSSTPKNIANVTLNLPAEYEILTLEVIASTPTPPSSKIFHAAFVVAGTVQNGANAYWYSTFLLNNATLTAFSGGAETHMLLNRTGPTTNSFNKGTMHICNIEGNVMVLVNGSTLEVGGISRMWGGFRPADAGKKDQIRLFGPTSNVVPGMFLRLYGWKTT